ncbi:hypothetical protein ACFPVT_05280 [Corynebacterium choanae]|uniref:hypothetical protein n=1 Tax=Corynebacterium choanae TaxID=1862358 RepID=UPI000F506BF9|nr:hypothetical protein [Corynebacterium choanae]
MTAIARICQLSPIPTCCNVPATPRDNHNIPYHSGFSSQLAVIFCFFIRCTGMLQEAPFSAMIWTLRNLVEAIPSAHWEIADNVA